MRALHLFAGAGGSVLTGRLLGWDSAGAVEIDPFCCRVLTARGERVLANDVKTFSGRALKALGNGWVPLQAATAFQFLCESLHQEQT